MTSFCVTLWHMCLHACLISLMLWVPGLCDTVVATVLSQSDPSPSTTPPATPTHEAAHCTAIWCVRAMWRGRIRLYWKASCRDLPQFSPEGWEHDKVRFYEQYRKVHVIFPHSLLYVHIWSAINTQYIDVSVSSCSVMWWLQECESFLWMIESPLKSYSLVVMPLSWLTSETTVRGSGRYWKFFECFLMSYWWFESVKELLC